MTSTLVGLYAVITLGTVVALAVLTGVAARWAPHEAWGHALIVAVFAGVLPLRWRAACRGSARAGRAVRIIAAVLLVVNLVEAFVPAFPVWMRVQMGVIAMIMLVILTRIPAHTAGHPRAAQG